jgi:hypothetical protein
MVSKLSVFLSATGHTCPPSLATTDSGRNVALGASGSSGSDSRACQSGAGGKELASSDADDAGKRGSRAILDKRGEADGAGCDGGGGTHIDTVDRECSGLEERI